MSVQTTMATADGRTIHGVNYRMAASAPPQPSVPASPYPFNGGVYHIRTALGWVDVPQNALGTVALTSVAYQ